MPYQGTLFSNPQPHDILAVQDFQERSTAEIVAILLMGAKKAFASKVS